MTDNGKFMVISLTFMRDDSCSESWKYSNFDELIDGCDDIEYYYRERYGAHVYFKDTQNSVQNCVYQSPSGQGAKATGLEADLSAYKGQTVSVIFAAVPASAPNTLCLIAYLPNVTVK